MATLTRTGPVGIRRHIPTAIQLLVIGIHGLPALLYQKHIVPGIRDAANRQLPDQESWSYLCSFDRPKWCRLVDKPVDEVA